LAYIEKGSVEAKGIIADDGGNNQRSNAGK